MTMLNKASGPPFRLILLVYVNAQAKGRYLFEKHSLLPEVASQSNPNGTS